MGDGFKNFLIKSPALDDKVVFITGGTGSFGYAFVDTIIQRYTPKKLIVFSRDEQKQFRMAQRYPDDKYPFMRYFIGDVRDMTRLDFALKEVDYVIHAAAMKHVHIAEYNPYECIHTNILGAENIVRASIRNGVKKVLALSTDKAVNPVNLYGATKLAAEKSFVAANNISGEDSTIFSVVRYGNVIGSNGSVVPLFRQMLEKGAKSLPLTDDRMTRFWITLSQSVDFVLSNLELMKAGEIFIPKIPSMKMIDLVQAIAPGCPTHEVGIRPGEKLHECMINYDESYNSVELKDRYIIPPYFSKSWHDDDIDYSVKDERFTYVSNENDEWLTAEQLLSVEHV